MENKLHYGDCTAELLEAFELFKLSYQFQRHEPNQTLSSQN